MPVDGFRDHVATDGTLLGFSGTWGACGWWQLAHDEEHGLFCLIMSLTSFTSLSAAERVETVVGQACESLVGHS